MFASTLTTVNIGSKTSPAARRTGFSPDIIQMVVGHPGELTHDKASKALISRFNHHWKDNTMTQSVYDFKATDIKGIDHALSEYKGKVLLIVNTASKCGFTPQFEGLEQLYKDLHGKGLVILGFPCNQFGHQDPGANEEIQEFCQLNYGVSFPMFAKIDVNGDDTHPLFKHLKTEAKGILGSENIKWNFTKFLVDKQGQVVKRYAPKDAPKNIRKDIEDLL